MDEAAFEHEYVRRKGLRRTLYERFDGDCVLFDKETRGCTVYPVRPTQCRTWPFWERNVESAEAWEETCQQCPGSGTGELVTVDRIRTRVEQTRVARTKW
ncbi:MAG: YkgJ family cysteine cluster protein [Polyangiaceae bacterium]